MIKMTRYPVDGELSRMALYEDTSISNGVLNYFVVKGNTNVCKLYLSIFPKRFHIGDSAGKMSTCIWLKNVIADCAKHLSQQKSVLTEVVHMCKVKVQASKVRPVMQWFTKRLIEKYIEYLFTFSTLYKVIIFSTNI